MITVGLTGGIGSGKSEVARLLAAHGAVVVDADALAREAVAPGTPGLAAVVGRVRPGGARGRRVAGPGRARPDRLRGPGRGARRWRRSSTRTSVGAAPS